MSVTDVCYVCGDEAIARCASCGGAVCDAHHDPSSGFCVRCRGGATVE